MRSQVKRSVIAASATLLVGTFVWSPIAPTSVSGQIPAAGLPAYTSARTAAGHPDLSGFWQAITGANWNIEDHAPEAAPFDNLVGAYLAQPPGLGIVVGGTIPYTPKGLARRNEHRENRLKPDPLPKNVFPYDAADPEAKCWAGGVPRATYMPFPFQIIQGRTKLFVAYGFSGSGSASRVIHLDKTFDDLLEVYDYPGQSVGRWDGESLVVDVRWFNTNVWLDRAGNYYGENAEVVERYTPMSPYHMMYEATITDPEVFTRPWTLRVPLYRIMEPADRLQMLEFQCGPLVDEFLYGRFKKGVYKLPGLEGVQP
jgi:hypothetical protein